MDNTAELCFLTAIELTQRIRARSISCVEVMEAHLRQIERVNPQVNAIVTLAPEQALAQARAADAALRRSDAVGPLHGLPVAHKDLVQTKGMRTTFGSPIYADFVPDVDDLIVTRIRNAGAILIGKTNTPEFGAGSQTFNPVFGATRNPYDLSKTCGGSSGGAAVALACGMLPIADGSDTGGSLRNPASFCNVVGFRPSPGRVPSCSDRAAWQTLSVPGPMARTVADAALLLSAMAGPHPCSPIALQKPGRTFVNRSTVISTVCAWRGAAPPADCPSIQRSPLCLNRRARCWKRSAASSKRLNRISPARTKRSRCGAPGDTNKNWASLPIRIVIVSKRRFSGKSNRGVR